MHVVINMQGNLSTVSERQDINDEWSGVAYDIYTYQVKDATVDTDPQLPSASASGGSVSCDFTIPSDGSQSITLWIHVGVKIDEYYTGDILKDSSTLSDVDVPFIIVISPND